MTGRNIGFWILILLLASTVVITGCSTATKRSNPLGSETDAESNVTEGSQTSGVDSEPSRNNDANLLPVVNVFASQTTVGAGNDINLRAEAIDPAGSPVTVEWQSTDGILVSVNGSSAVWQAPAYTSKPVISCVVTNSRGGKTKNDLEIEVIGNSFYKLNLLVDRCSFAASVSDSSEEDFVPAAGARVVLKAFNDVAISDRNGNVEFVVTQANKIATYSDIEVSYRDWNVKYNAKLISVSGSTVSDNMIFSPGFENLSVARCCGDSFDLKKGIVEVTTSEKNTIGVLEPLPEVSVNCSVTSAVSSRDTGLAVIQPSVANPETNIKISKTGYSTIEGCTIPVNSGYTTIVSAEMIRNTNISDYDASVAYVKPYNYKKNISVMEPFVIGFNQAMEKNTIFDNISLMVQNKTAGQLIPMTGKEIKEFFNIDWKGSSVVSLTPKHGYDACSRYCILINNWTARSIDGRWLKSYTGTYYEFSTDEDPEPKITAYEPLNGTTKVSRKGPFTIYFDRPIKPDSLYEETSFEFADMTDETSVTISGSMISSFFSVVWKDNNTTLQFVPNNTLSPFHIYQIRIKKCSFKSESGKAVSGLENFWTQFTTGGL